MLRDADNVVFCLPLYIDGVPSHVLGFMREMERFCRDNGLSLHVYAISNGGFIEGNQSRPLMRVLESFCARSGRRWGGGIGIGGGVALDAKIDFAWQHYIPTPFGTIPSFFSIDIGLDAQQTVINDAYAAVATAKSDMDKVGGGVTARCRPASSRFPRDRSSAASCRRRCRCSRP